MVDSPIRLFNAELPIYLVRGRDAINRKEFIYLLKKKTRP
jgi:hypothetical protein